MGQEEAAAAVVFSWEQELRGVSKQGAPAWQNPALAARDDMPESPKKAPARRLTVPPPPGRLPLAATKSFSKARAVRPEDDPFLAAYLACTKSSGGAGDYRKGGRSVEREPKGHHRRLTWSGLGLGFGLGLGLGLSCKSSNGVVENSMVRMGKLPEVNPRDA